MSLWQHNFILRESWEGEKRMDEVYCIELTLYLRLWKGICMHMEVNNTKQQAVPGY